MNGPHALPGYASQAIDRKLGSILPRGYIDGLTLANSAGDATNDIDIAAGVCRSRRNVIYLGSAAATLDIHQRDMEIPASLTKQLDVAWAPGNGGMRHAGTAISDTTWHLFVIGGRGLKDDVFAYTDVIPSAVLPSGYTAYRLIGSVIRVSSALVAFTQYGDHFLLSASVLSVNATGDHTTAALGTLRVPTGLQVSSEILVRVTGPSGGDDGVLVTSPDVTDVAPSKVTAPGLVAVAGYTGGAGEPGWSRMRVKTDTSGRVRYRASDANVDTLIITEGWWHPRGRDLS